MIKLDFFFHFWFIFSVRQSVKTPFFGGNKGQGQAFILLFFSNLAKRWEAQQQRLLLATTLRLRVRTQKEKCSEVRVGLKCLFCHLLIVWSKLCYLITQVLTQYKCAYNNPRRVIGNEVYGPVDPRVSFTSFHLQGKKGHQGLVSKHLRVLKLETMGHGEDRLASCLCVWFSTTKIELPWRKYCRHSLEGLCKTQDMDTLVSRWRNRKESGADEPCFYPCQGNSIWLQSDQDGRMEGSSEVRLNVFWGRKIRTRHPEDLCLRRLGASIIGRRTPVILWALDTSENWGH